ncbi:tetratricopeptide repeat protein [Pseudoxanthomonas gei]|uniref:Tetratricopeptide repeat protein n=1 Tax=Pseudoxanthomonas gei TaxID=1383030 RepID=A0ABX0ADB7_9GAMM|nr:sulfotransferase [Pseudoxanthomonas gei]NDK38236.1 tetratricopeptide repeat protein [Pseudoxanthomonas gei]
MLIERRLQQIRILQQDGKWAEARRQLDGMIAEFPVNPSIRRAMALHASGSGQAALALEHMEVALRLAPDSADLQFQLGCLRAHAGKYPEALELFQKTTALMPLHADSWYFLGITLLRLKRDMEALSALRNAHRVDPSHPKALRALADLEFRIGYPVDALPLFRELMRLDPDDIDACLKNSETLSRLGFHDQAIALYQAALRRQPAVADLWMALAQAEEDNDDREAAEQAYSRALELKPGWAFPVSGLLGLKRGGASEALVRRAVEMQADPMLPDPDRALIGYELGKVFDGRSQHAMAMASWDDANAARKRLIGEPDLPHLYSSVDRTVELFRREFFANHGLSGSQDQRMVFIVGMPRSGTTLTEQIIASHPQAHGCGELPDLALIVRNIPVQLGIRAGWPEFVTSMTESTLQESIARYTQAATRHAPAAALRLVDKAPLNFYYLGLVAMMFPQARIIWCRRDPRDVAVSIYGENFALEEKIATSWSGIGHYINLQERLMRHWQAVLPLPILESSYESLVSSPEEQARRIIDFTGLEWDAACLDFHLSGRGVQTPSRWQVKQPMHTRSVGRWRNYEAELAPLLDVLDNPPA